MSLASVYCLQVKMPSMSHCSIHPQFHPPSKQLTLWSLSVMLQKVGKKKKYRTICERETALKCYIQPEVGDDSKALCRYGKCEICHADLLQQFPHSWQLSVEVVCR